MPPAFGDGLAFLPEGQTLLALDERTGELVWSHTFDSRLNEIGEAENFVSKAESRIYYDKGYIFAQTLNHLAAFNATTGDLIWQILKQEDFAYYPPFQVINDVVVINEQYVPFVHGSFGSPHFADIVDLKTGNILWRVQKPQANDNEIVYYDQNYIYMNVHDYAARWTTLSQYEIRTGKAVKECFSGNQGKPQIPPPPNFLYGLVSDGTWLYGGNKERPNPTNIYRLPLCEKQVASQPEQISETLDKYLLSDWLYADIQPFVWLAGPYKDFLLFTKIGENGGGLYKVTTTAPPVHFYHDRVSDESYIEPTFEQIEPVPYQIFPNVEGYISALEVIDDFVITATTDGFVQINDFNTLETLFRVQTDFVNYKQVNLVKDVLVIHAYVDTLRESVAFRVNIKK